MDSREDRGVGESRLNWSHVSPLVEGRVGGCMRKEGEGAEEEDGKKVKIEKRRERALLLCLFFLFPSCSLSSQ
jgi:hypothetical protein